MSRGAGSKRISPTVRIAYRSATLLSPLKRSRTITSSAPLPARLSLSSKIRAAPARHFFPVSSAAASCSPMLLTLSTSLSTSSSTVCVAELNRSRILLEILDAEGLGCDRRDVRASKSCCCASTEEMEEIGSEIGGSNGSAGGRSRLVHVFRSSCSLRKVSDVEQT